MKKYYAMTFGSEDRTGRYYFDVEMDDISEYGLIDCDGVGIQHDEYEPSQLVQVPAFELEFDEDDDGEWIPTNSDSKELTKEQFDTIESIYNKAVDSIMETGFVKSWRDIEEIELSNIKWVIEKKKPGWELAEKVAAILKKAFEDIESAEKNNTREKILSLVLFQ